MKGLKYIFLLIVVTKMMACGIEKPSFGLDLLQGDWRRISSTDPRSDEMRLRIIEDYAVITHVPATSDFVVGETKWSEITSVVESWDFQFYDLGAGLNQRSKSSIVIKSSTYFIVTNLNYPDAPGGVQEWVKL